MDKTNDILREVIDELYRNNSDQLPERRMRMDSDHDLLIRIETTLNNNGKKLDDFIVETKNKLAQHDSSIKWQSQILYGAFGAIAFLEFIFKVLK